MSDKPSGKPENGRRNKILIGLGAIALFGAGWLAYRAWAFVTTDNAFVQGHTVMIASKVPGIVNEVLVDENQAVKEGQILVRIDPRDIQNQLAQIEAELGSSQARLRDAQTTFHRISSLYSKGAVAQQQFDTASATYKDSMKRATAIEAQLAQSKLNLSYADIKAPSDGMIARRSVEPGQVVPVGQPLLGFVEGRTRWIVANFKETDLPELKIGRAAHVDVDAIPGKRFRAEVESFSPSTGATFTLLPPDNATGNFTKVVQRVPVRLKLLDLAPEDIRELRVGLSAEVTVRAH